MWETPNWGQTPIIRVISVGTVESWFGSGAPAVVPWSAYPLWIGHVARLPRYSLPGVPQHVIQRGNNRTRMFLGPPDYWTFRKHLRTACDDFGCRIHAYVFMSNHVHLIMSPESADSVGRVIQAVGRRYVPYFNRSSGRTGALWESRYRATVIASDDYLFACYRYVELNPVRAAMVAQPGDYPWSSYRANALGQQDDLVTPHERYTSLGRMAYRDLVAVALESSTVDEIRAASHKGWALGTVVSQRRGRPLPSGRPPAL